MDILCSILPPVDLYIILLKIFTHASKLELNFFLVKARCLCILSECCSCHCWCILSYNRPYNVSKISSFIKTRLDVHGWDS